MNDHFAREAAANAERKRLAQIYERTPHFQKWDRLERLSLHKFHASVSETKPFFDCLSMIGMSATIFGLALFWHLSQSMNELCERPTSSAFAVLGIFGLFSGLLAFRPVRPLAVSWFAGLRKSALETFPARETRGPRRGSGFAIVLIGLAYTATFVMAGSIAVQIAARAPIVECVGPMP